MNQLGRKLLMALFVMALYQPLSHAAADDPAASVQTELRIEFSVFGQGMAEAFRGLGKHAVPRQVTEHLVISEQVGPGYRIRWVAKKSASEPSFPEYMRLTRLGTVLPGNAILGKTSQAEVIERMGVPHTRSPERLTYLLPGFQGDDKAILTFNQGRLAAVEWQWFVD
jgi:hypothetical protein